MGVAMWTEQVDTYSVESKIFPRADALAELLWSNPSEKWIRQSRGCCSSAGDSPTGASWRTRCNPSGVASTPASATSRPTTRSPTATPTNEQFQRNLNNFVIQVVWD